MNTVKRNRITRAVLLILMFAAVHERISRADIFQWEYINPADPSQGKQQSATLCPDGAGVVAAPYADLSNRNLTMAYFSAADLTNAQFWYSTLTDADLTDAAIVGASFWGTTSLGFTREQLYSTASYKNHDLTGIGLESNDLTGWNFAGQKLTNADFYYSTLTNINLSQANLTNADLSESTLTNADLSQANLTNAISYESTLTDADLSQANLTNAYFGGSQLTNADLTNAAVVGASFGATTSRGFTQEQLYSTASYKNHDLSGIRLESNDLTGWNFAGQNLTNAAFDGATITKADFTDAEVREASFSAATGFTAAQFYSTASYRAHDLSGIRLDNNDLTGWNFVGQNLANIFFGYTTLTNADFTGAVVRGTIFAQVRGFAEAQLYSTASYNIHDLSGIRLDNNDLTGWDFAGQNLTNVAFYISIGVVQTFPELREFQSATLTNADLHGTDTRGSLFDRSTAIVVNTILPDGHIQGLELAAGQTLAVRDYDGNPEPYPWDELLASAAGPIIDILEGYPRSSSATPPIPIHVDDHFMMGPGGVLQILFEEDAWDSTISFEAGIPVTLAGGTLELAFAEGVNLASQLGRSFQVFDWTGVSPTGEFNIMSPYVWDASRLYSAGEVTFVGVPEVSSLTLLTLGISILLIRKLR